MLTTIEPESSLVVFHPAKINDDDDDTERIHTYSMRSNRYWAQTHIYCIGPKRRSEWHALILFKCKMYRISPFHSVLAYLTCVLHSPKHETIPAHTQTHTGSDVFFLHFSSFFGSFFCICKVTFGHSKENNVCICMDDVRTLHKHP